MSTPNPTPSAEAMAAALRGLDYAIDWRNRKPDAVTFATGLADARQYIIDAGARITALETAVQALDGDKKRLTSPLNRAHHELSMAALRARKIGEPFIANNYEEAVHFIDAALATHSEGKETT